MSTQSLQPPTPVSSPTRAEGVDAALAVDVADVSKCYRLYNKPAHRFWDLLRLGKPRYREFWALRRIYLQIPKGATVGIIGENGAGKSTLLKLISGVSEPTTGHVRVRGRLTSLIELGAGFHPEFSGRENIRLSCQILGMSQEEAEERIEPIIRFSELGEFIDRPVKTYSSGMYVRLGFSVATCVDPEVLLVDEALSVGDEHFKGKCMRRLNDFTERGGTTIFVSHDIGAIKSMCSHVVLIDQGEIVEQGSPERVADEYLKRVKARGDQALSFGSRGSSEYPRWGSGEVEVHEVDILGADREPARVLSTGEAFTVRMRYRVHGTVAQAVFGIGLYRSDGSYINGSNHHWRREPIDLGRLEPGEEGEVEMSLESLPLLQGQYYVTTFLYDHSKPSPTAIDHREHAQTFQVLDTQHHQHGLLELPTRWVVRRRPSGGSPMEHESRA